METRITVIGAGIVGATLADALTRRGARVTVVESATPGGWASGGSFAWINANRKPPRDYHDLSVAGMAEWHRFAAGFGSPDWYAPTGALTWAVTASARTDLAGRMERLHRWGYRVEELTVAAATAREPGLRIPAGALVAAFPDEAYAHGPEVVEVTLARARAGGATVLTGDPAVGFDSTGDTVDTVRLASGRGVSGEIQVCCAGWRTPALLAGLTDALPVPVVPVDTVGSPAPGLVVDLGAGAPAPVRGVVLAPELTVRPLPGGGARVEAGDLSRRIDLHTPVGERDAFVSALTARARSLLPGWDPTSPRARVCVRPLPVDGHPVVGWVAPTVYAVVTHSGVTLAPLLARLVSAELVTGEPTVGLAPWRPGRFTPPGTPDQTA